MKTLKCTTCKHLIDKEDAQIVKHTLGDRTVVEIAYCPEHKVGYDRSEDGWYDRYYYKEMIVNKDGSMILPFGKKLVDDYRIVVSKKTWIEEHAQRETTVAYIILGLCALGMVSVLLLANGFTCHF